MQKVIEVESRLVLWTLHIRKEVEIEEIERERAKNRNV